MPMLKKTICFVIMVSLISPATLPSNGYGDDWVYVDRDKESTQYYQSSSVKIDKQKKDN